MWRGLFFRINWYNVSTSIFINIVLFIYLSTSHSFQPSLKRVPGVKVAWCKSCLVYKVPSDCDISISKYRCLGLSGYPVSSFECDEVHDDYDVKVEDDDDDEAGHCFW